MVWMGSKMNEEVVGQAKKNDCEGAHPSPWFGMGSHQKSNCKISYETSVRPSLGSRTPDICRSCIIDSEVNL